MSITGRDDEFRETCTNLWLWAGRGQIPKDQLHECIALCRDGWTGEDISAWIADLPKPEPSVVSRLHREGQGFVTEDGSQWIWKGASNFLLFQRYLHGEDIAPLLYTGSNLQRFTVTMQVVPQAMGLPVLKPEHYAPGFWPAFDQFFNLLAEHGQYGEATIFCDQKVMGTDEAWQQRVFGQAVEIMRSKPNAILELANEWNHPTQKIDPSKFAKPSGLISSRGSGLADSPPFRPGWDFFGFHGRRDWPKVTSSTEDMWAIGNAAKDGWKSDTHQKMIAVHDEPIGFAEAAIPNKRSSDPKLARLLGVASRVLGAGGTFHSDSGLRSEPLGPVQQQCADAFFSALD